MLNNKLNVKESFYFGFNFTNKFFVLTVIPIAIVDIIIFTTMFFYQIHFHGGVLKLLFQLPLTILLIFIIYSGLLKMITRWIDKLEKPKLIDYFSWKWSLLGKYFVVSLLYYFLFSFGLLLLIIPGIYVGIIYFFVQFIVLDQNLLISEIFKKSIELTKKFKWTILIFLILTSSLNMLSNKYFSFFKHINYSIMNIFIYIVPIIVIYAYLFAIINTSAIYFYKNVSK